MEERRGWRRESIKKRDGGETKGRREDKRVNEKRGVRIKEEIVYVSLSL